MTHDSASSITNLQWCYCYLKLKNSVHWKKADIIYKYCMKNLTEKNLNENYCINVLVEVVKLLKL